MKKLLTLIFLLLRINTAGHASIQAADSITRYQFIHQKTAIADTLNHQALQLVATGETNKNLNKAISLVMKGLHIYSRYRDSVGLRQTFDHLGLFYHLQKKYVQAKWFTIQANSFAREMHDTVEIVHTLINLAAVKTDIKDYDLAKRDLNEALLLAKLKPKIDLQVEVQKGLAAYYTQKGDVKKSASVMNRIIFLKDSVNKADENKRLDLIKKEYRQQQAKQILITQQKQNTLRIEAFKLRTIVEQKNAVAVIALSATAAVVLIVAVFYSRRKRRRRKRRKVNHTGNI